MNGEINGKSGKSLGETSDAEPSPQGPLFWENPTLWGRHPHGPTQIKESSLKGPQLGQWPQALPISAAEEDLTVAKLLQWCLTLYDPIDGSLPGSPIPGILQARTQEWVATSFSNAWKWKVKVKSLSHVGLFATPWIAAHQAPPPMGFSGQEYWSGLPLPSPDLTALSTKLRPWQGDCILRGRCFVPLGALECVLKHAVKERVN